MRKQTIYSEPQKLFVEEYKTKSGQKKKRYKKNPNAKQIKQIRHK